MNAVTLLRAEAGSAPSGTGSFNYFSNFLVVVENLAYNKLVGIWGHEVGAGTWSFYPCSYSHSVPGNNEIWNTSTGESRIDQFDVEYQVLGNVYWDNNSNYNYIMDIAAAEGTNGVGTAVINPPVLAVSWGIDAAGNLNVEVLVKNLAFQKQVAIIYTTNNWLTFFNVFGKYERSFAPPTMPHQVQTELWNIAAPVGLNKSGVFAVFYVVNNTTYWDNNFGLNYSF